MAARLKFKTPRREISETSRGQFYRPFGAMGTVSAITAAFYPCNFRIVRSEKSDSLLRQHSVGLIAIVRLKLAGSRGESRGWNTFAR